MPDPASATEARNTLLTVDGKGKAAKAAALDALVQQAHAAGVAEGIERFRPYARHLPYCDKHFAKAGTDEAPACSCGLDRALGRDQEGK